MEMFIDVFIDMVQTAGVSADNQGRVVYALFVVREQATCSSVECQTIPKERLRIGYIDSQGKVLVFKDNGFQGNANVIANFDQRGHRRHLHGKENQSRQLGQKTIFVQNDFVVDATNKVFCKKLPKARKSTSIL